MQNNNYPQIGLSAYTDEFNAMEHILNTHDYNNIHTVIPVKIVEIKQGLVNVKPLIKAKNIIGEVIDTNAIICNIPVMQTIGQKFKITIEPSVGDKGLLVACMDDMTEYKNKHDYSVVTNNRHYNFSDGVFLPLDFTGATNGVEISYNDAYLKLQENNIIINCNNATVNSNNNVDLTCKSASIEASDNVSVECSSATVTSTGSASLTCAGASITSTSSVDLNCVSANINASSVNLGGSGGEQVARVGDRVNLQTGFIVSGSSVVKAR